MLETIKGWATLHPTLGKVSLWNSTTNQTQARVWCQERISGFSKKKSWIICSFFPSLYFPSNEEVLLSLLSSASALPQTVHISIFSSPSYCPLSLFSYILPQYLIGCAKYSWWYSSHPSFILKGDYPTTRLTGNQIFGVEDSSRYKFL